MAGYIDTEGSSRRAGKGEDRIPPAAAVVVAIGVCASLPSALLHTNRLLTPAAEVAFLGALLATNPRRMTRETRWSRKASIGLASLVILTNLGSLGLLVSELTSSASGKNLLVGAMQIWVTHVIGLGLLYWEIDRGGPVIRRRGHRTDLLAADWLNPTDMMPLSSRAKILMGIQATAALALLVSLVVVSFAVGSLGK